MISRRLILAGSAALIVAGIGATNREILYAAMTETRAGGTLSAPAALDAAREGRAILIDIRRPDEWAETGRPEGSVPLDMRRHDFTEALARIADGDRAAPIVLICARGVRSAGMANRLRQEGFTAVADVPEGMLGSVAGPGWLARGLPLEGE